jgi:DnaJ-class molecular chaperone
MSHEELIARLRRNAASGDSDAGTSRDMEQAADALESLSRKHANLVQSTTKPKKTEKGCRACFGSGGKRADPCKICNGTGRVPRD